MDQAACVGIVQCLANLSDDLAYEWKRQGQYADWIYISVEFDTGFAMVCRFREASPVLLDQCVEVSPISDSR